MSSVQTVRDAILEAPFELDNTGETPSLGTLYIPLAHRKALSREAVLVVGARGVGKSFWTAALSDDVLRKQIGETVRDLAHSRIAVGFAAKPSIDTYPDRDTLKSLLDDGQEPYAVWRAVVIRWLARLTQNTQIPIQSWDATVRWGAQSPENVAQLAEAANAALETTNEFGLIIFDALDRSSTNWATMNLVVRDLLQITLWLRDFPRLRAKVFLRPDQMERTVTSFVDASKILATKADLTWERYDLHAMLWQRLINAPGVHGERLRELASDVLTGADGLQSANGNWVLPMAMRSETPYQRPLFETLAGDKMGKDARRGVPYVWSVGHLADGHGSTSPRSFLAAVASAAQDSLTRYRDYPLALHYESLKRGIRRASQIRVQQVSEDDPWVPEAMKPLAGSNVPADYDMVKQSWETYFPDGPASIPSDLLPPQHVENWDGLRKDLERLGIFVTRKDGRIDMPDLYRVGFNLGRKGGVAPRSN